MQMGYLSETKKRQSSWEIVVNNRMEVGEVLPTNGPLTITVSAL